MLVTLSSPTPARADPFQIDLTKERKEYERLSFNRNMGLSLAAATAISGGLAIYGYGTALDTRDTLLAQQPPFSSADREALVAQGRSANTLGVLGILLTLATGAGSYYFLSASF